MYKHVNGLLPNVMSELYITNDEIHEHNTRQCKLFHTNKGNTNLYAKGFSNISPRLWNALQKNINVNISIARFKNRSKSLFSRTHSRHQLLKVITYVLFLALTMQVWLE